MPSIIYDMSLVLASKLFQTVWILCQECRERCFGTLQLLADINHVSQIVRNVLSSISIQKLIEKNLTMYKEFYARRTSIAQI